MRIHYLLSRRVPFKTVILACALLIAACGAKTSGRPGFEAALERHLAAIQSRDLESFASTLTSGDTLYMIFPNGEALTTRAQAIALHEEWFANPDWVWEGRVIRKIVGTDMATVLMQYDYRDTQDSPPRSAWLVLVFRLEDGNWRLVHDQNTTIGTGR